MLNPGIVIVRIVEESLFDALGHPQPKIRVEFKVDAHGPFTERFAKDAYTAAARDERLNAFAHEVRG